MTNKKDTAVILVELLEQAKERKKNGLTEVEVGEIIPSKVLERAELYKHGDALYTSYTYPYMTSQTTERNNVPTPLLYIKIDGENNIVLKIECILPNE